MTAQSGVVCHRTHSLHIDCGCTWRLNLRPVDNWNVGDYVACDKHSATREYDPQTGDPIPERDRRVTRIERDRLSPQEPTNPA